MDTKEAIAHINEIIANPQTCEECRQEHLQLRAWLERLETLEAENARLQKYNDTLIADNNLLRNELDAQDLLAHEDDIEFA